MVVTLFACGDDSDDIDVEPLVEDCNLAGECVDSFCIADLSAMPQDVAALALHCAPLLEGADEGAPCSEASDCARGICLLSGFCARACLNREADILIETNELCLEAYAKTGSETLQSVFVRTAPVIESNTLATYADQIFGTETGDDFLFATATESPTEGTAEFIVWPYQSNDVYATLFQTQTEPPQVLFNSLDLQDPYALAPINPVYAIVPTFTVRIPIGSQTAEQTSGWMLRLVSETPSGIFLQSIQPQSAGHTLDLNLYYVGVPDWIPTGDVGPIEVEQALTELRTLSTTAGFELGQVRHRQVVGELAADLSFLSLDAEQHVLGLDRLLALSLGSPTPALNIFFVRSLGGLVGVSGGIPVPAALHGSPASGLAIAIDWVHMVAENQSETFAQAFPRVLFHEMVHALGLFHTTEVSGIVVEPIADTPECRLTYDANDNGVVEEDECQAAGADNLMFWSAASTALTDQQKVALSRSPLLR